MKNIDFEENRKKHGSMLKGQKNFQDIKLEDVVTNEEIDTYDKKGSILLASRRDSIELRQPESFHPANLSSRNFFGWKFNEHVKSPKSKAKTLVSRQSSIDVRKTAFKSMKLDATLCASLIKKMFESHALVDDKDSFNQFCVLSMQPESIMKCEDFDPIGSNYLGSFISHQIEVVDEYFNSDKRLSNEMFSSFCFPNGIEIRLIPCCALEGAERLGWCGGSSDKYEMLSVSRSFYLVYSLQTNRGQIFTVFQLLQRKYFICLI